MTESTTCITESVTCITETVCCITESATYITESFLSIMKVPPVNWKITHLRSKRWVWVSQKGHLVVLWSLFVHVQAKGDL